MVNLSKFLNQHTAYDLVPLSTQIIILDAQLPLAKAIAILLYHGLILAPLWKSESMSFIGLFTVLDLIQLVLDAGSSALDLDSITLEACTKHHQFYPFVKVHPLRSLIETTSTLIDSQPLVGHVPLVDVDPISNQEILVSVVSKASVLQFLATHCPDIHQLTSTIAELKLGTDLSKLQTLSLKSTLLEAIQFMINHQISGIPIVNEHGNLIDVFTETDVLITLRQLPTPLTAITMDQIIHGRSNQEMEPIYTCEINEPVLSLLNTVQLGVKTGRNVKRFIIVNEKQQVSGILSLGDLLIYIWHNFVP